MLLRVDESERGIASIRLELTNKELAIEEANTARKAVEWRLSERFDEIAALSQRLREKDKENAVTRGDSEAVISLRRQLAEKDNALAQAKGASQKSAAQLAKRFDEIAALTQALRQKEDVLREKAGESAAAHGNVTRLEAEKKEAESQLTERFVEIARLTRIVSEAEAAARRAQAQSNWLRETASILANGSRTFKGKLSACLPAAWRRARQMDHLKQSGLFDAEAYFSSNPDVAKSTQDPLRHYLRHGLLEDRPLSVSAKGEAK